MQSSQLLAQMALPTALARLVTGLVMFVVLAIPVVATGWGYRATAVVVGTGEANFDANATFTRVLGTEPAIRLGQREFAASGWRRLWSHGKSPPVLLATNRTGYLEVEARHPDALLASRMAQAAAADYAALLDRSAALLARQVRAATQAEVQAERKRMAVRLQELWREEKVLRQSIRAEPEDRATKAALDALLVEVRVQQAGLAQARPEVPLLEPPPAQVHLRFIDRVLAPGTWLLLGAALGAATMIALVPGRPR